tara:strand:- start:6390 stop:6935 length:546 start_codon:yes stop_codon:yes gene_type:complete
MTKNNCQELLLSSLNQYYNNNIENKELFNNIINGKDKLSLRLIDWFVTHYARNNNIYYWTNNIEIFEQLPDNFNDNNIKKVNIYLDYRAQLKSYTKLYFDTFRRHQRITFYINDNISIETTIGQLNFFRWIFNNNILEYTINNYDIIYKSMTEQNKSTKKQKKNYNKFQEIVKTKCVLNFD